MKPAAREGAPARSGPVVSKAGPPARRGAARLPRSPALQALGDGLGTATVVRILMSSCVSPWQCPCQTRGPLCSVDLYPLVARRPEAFWEMPRMTLAEGPCSRSLEKWSPGEGRGKERSPWHRPLPKGGLWLRTGMAPAFRESPLPARRPGCCRPVSLGTWQPRGDGGSPMARQPHGTGPTAPVPAPASPSSPAATFGGDPSALPRPCQASV